MSLKGHTSAKTEKANRGNGFEFHTMCNSLWNP